MTDRARRSGTLQQALAKGLGRAHRMLADRPEPAARTALLDACLRNLAYDPQAEPSRARYLAELVQLADVTDLAVERLSDLLAGDPAPADIVQRFELAAELAAAGETAMLAALEVGLEHLVDERLDGRGRGVAPAEVAGTLVAAGGAAGAVAAFAQLGRLHAADPEAWDDDWLLEAARMAPGADPLDRWLTEARRRDARVDAYLRAVERPAPRDEDAGHRDPAWMDGPWPAARQALEREVRGGGRVNPLLAARWGERATPGALEAAARDLSGLHGDAELLRAWLWVFSKRAFPLDPAPLIALVDDPRDRVAWFALNALGQVRHPAVRALALRMADRGPLRARALDLLAVNWEARDERLAADLVEAAELDEDGMHTLGLGLLEVVERRPDAPVEAALLAAYERGPCGGCRRRFVAALLDRHALPDELRQECRFDANAGTRALVA